MDWTSPEVKGHNVSPVVTSTVVKQASTASPRPDIVVTKAIIHEMKTSERTGLSNSSPQRLEARERAVSSPGRDLAHTSKPSRSSSVSPGFRDGKGDEQVSASIDGCETNLSKRRGIGSGVKLSTDVEEDMKGVKSAHAIKKPLRTSVRFACDEEKVQKDENVELSSAKYRPAVMTLKEFENLPPMWEEGGRFSSQWGDNCGEGWSQPSQTAGDRGTIVLLDVETEETDLDDPDEVFSKRDDDIEQTLREIYISPFHPTSHLPPVSPSPATGKQSRVDSAGIGLPAPSALASSPMDDEEVKDVEDVPDGARSLQEVPLKRSKSMLQLAAERAVSGYRSCDDVDAYVGTRKPTLILARAPPTPFGILRRSNRKEVKGKLRR